MDPASKVREVAVARAEDDADLASALPAFLRVSLDRSVLQTAVARVDLELASRPRDPVVQRARELIVGALTTTPYNNPSRPRDRWF